MMLMVVLRILNIPTIAVTFLSIVRGLIGKKGTRYDL